MRAPHNREKRFTVLLRQLPASSLRNPVTTREDVNGFGKPSQESSLRQEWTSAPECSAPNIEYRIDADRLGLNQGQFYANANYQYVGSRGVDVQHTFDLKAYSLVNARIGWEGNNAGVYLFANNIFNERYETSGASYGPGFDLVLPGVGRTIGLGATVKF